MLCNHGKNSHWMQNGFMLASSNINIADAEMEATVMRNFEY